ncbi:hypothetical protein [Olleya namhaensis]|uniref:hypothetical protein n=1 Tax=Olleya namhaensis TaxID=1144750 RepID=UPI00248FDDB1|nr:hypothetical protein [Olleya namhaensis]
MTKISIQRHSEWNNKAREIGIYIDNKKVGVINDGDTQEYPTESGTHEVFAKIDWCRSQKIEINLNQDETKMLTLSGFKYGTWIMPILLGLLLLYYILTYVLNINAPFLMGLPAIAFLYPMYYITLGKNRYLTLTENKQN